MAAVVNRARRGVGNIGLLQHRAMCKSRNQHGLGWGRADTNLPSLSLKFCDKSAASEAPGEEPRTGLLLKYSGLGSWKVNWPLPRGLGTRCGPKRLDCPKEDGGAGRIAASGEDVSMAVQEVGACTDAVACFYVSGETRRCRAARIDCRMPLGAAELEVDKLEGSRAQVGAERGGSARDAAGCSGFWSPGDRVDINRRRPPRVHLLRKSPGAKGRRLLGPNFSFLSSSGATRAVCGFGAGRTRERGSL